ncbi:UPF0182 family protein [candidate division KSB1 bacterium]|nr:UPF0182 family protein [candidate division KSB1 bacterium]
MLGFIVAILFALFYIPLLRTCWQAIKMRKFIWENVRVSLTIAILGTIFMLLILKLLNIYTEFLWFDSLKFVSVFWTILSWKWGLFFGAALFSLVFLKSNVFSVRRFLIRLQAKTKKAYDEIWQTQLVPANILFNLLIILCAILLAVWAMSRWETVLLFLNRMNTGTTEPIFKLDTGFYLFVFPFLTLVINWLLVFFLVRTALQLLAILVYGVSADKYFDINQRRLFGRHLIYLFSKDLAFLSLILIGKTILAIFNLMYSTRGVVFGASFTDVFAQITAYETFIFVLAGATLLFIISLFVRKGRLLIWTIGAVAFAWLIVVIIYPAIIQQYVVKPNELAKETPFIKYNIKFTRDAFNLNSIAEKEFSAQGVLNSQSLEQNAATIENIRLWDWRALWLTFKQIQEIRLYYEFDEVDIDRYWLNGRYRQVMLSPRELSTDQLPARSKTWINQHFKYTHGYGVCANAVNEFTSEGLPKLLIKDMPPVNVSGAPEITQPQIYFGERTDTHCFVKTSEQEFDYPLGSSNQYTVYEGSGGILINSFLRRLAFAWRFDGLRLLLPNPLTPESRIMFRRDLQQRVRALAPFLAFDDDPYLIIDNNGKLWWLWDAYTISNMYPYSERFKGLLNDKREFNYIRNSVKVAIDAYNGRVRFYVVDPADPLIQVYMKIFPRLFFAIDEMPDDFVSHLRYPEDYLRVQASVYRSYHMTDPQVFYNKEDLWEIATETYISDVREVLPYYVILRLPDNQREEFLQMIPFTPTRKNNMIGWMAGRCDGENYGKLIVYQFPKDKLVYGPMQIEARIDQDREISAQLTLWGQLGSRVIRGNLLVIPMNDALLYVEPLYLQSEQAKMPELKQIIVAHGDRLAWGKTFAEALDLVFSEQEDATRSTSAAELLQTARNHFRQYKELTGKGRFNEAASHLDALEKLFREAGRK